MNTEMIEQNECPICMDKIEGNKNKLVTECGHCFHTSCLLKNAAHNGFGCPYCRTTLAEEPEDSEDEYDDDDDDNDDDNDDDDNDDDGNEDLYSNNVLSGMRWLFQRASGEDIDADPAENSWQEDAVPTTPPTPTPTPTPSPYPSIASIVERLGVYNMDVETLVKYIVEKEYSEYYTCDEDHQYEIEEMIENIIFNPPAQEQAQEQAQAPAPTPTLTPTPTPTTEAQVPNSEADLQLIELLATMQRLYSRPLEPVPTAPPTETPLRKTLNSALKIINRMSTASIALFK